MEQLKELLRKEPDLVSRVFRAARHVRSRFAVGSQGIPDAEDVAQDILLSIGSREESTQPLSNSLLRCMAKNRIIDALRRPRCKYRHAAGVEQLCGRDDFAALDDSEEARVILDRIRKCLQEPHRKFLDFCREQDVDPMSEEGSCVWRREFLQASLGMAIAGLEPERIKRAAYDFMTDLRKDCREGRQALSESDRYIAEIGKAARQGNVPDVTEHVADDVRTRLLGLVPAPLAREQPLRLGPVEGLLDRIAIGTERQLSGWYDLL